jgi:hypothetical protein
MLNPSIYTRFYAYQAVALESELMLIPERIREGLQMIDERLSGPAQMDES